MHLYQLLVVHVSLSSLAGHVDDNAHMTPVLFQTEITKLEKSGGKNQGFIFLNLAYVAPILAQAIEEQEEEKFIDTCLVAYFDQCQSHYGFKELLMLKLEGLIFSQMWTAQKTGAMESRRYTGRFRSLG